MTVAMGSMAGTGCRGTMGFLAGPVRRVRGNDIVLFFYTSIKRVFMYVYVYVGRYVCVYVYQYVGLYVCMYVSMYLCMYVCR